MNVYSFHIVILLSLYVHYSATFGENNVLEHLGTRTPYRFKYNKDDSRIKYPGCKDTMIWMLIRHGTRLPSAKDIVRMNTTLRSLKNEILHQHQKGIGVLEPEHVKKIAEWSTNLKVEQEKDLTHEGEDEMVLLAERMHKRFPNAIKNKYSNISFQFRYTATQRTQQSARYFTTGLFDKKVAQNIMFAPARKLDPVLRFYKHCDKWQKEVKKNPETFKQQKLFGDSRIMNETMQSVSNRLGLDKVLSLGDVTLMYKICGFETAWNKHHVSPWCYAFDEDSAEALEYYYDLKHYWIDGYGHNLTYRQACMAIKTMFDIFKSNQQPFASFNFAHSGTLLKILSHFQLYKPEQPLMGDHMDKARIWKVTNIDCFASNIAFVLYKCKDGPSVLTLYQERVIKLPMCEKELCPLQQLEEYFHESIYNCDYSDMCSLNNDSS